MNRHDNTQQEERIIKDIIKRYGDVIDLRQSPFLIIEILRNYRNAPINEPNDGGLPGGVPPSPPPGPSGFDGIRNSDILKEILRLSRDIEKIKNTKAVYWTGLALIALSSGLLFFGSNRMKRNQPNRMRGE